MPDVDDHDLPRGAGGAEQVEARPAASTIVLRRDPFDVLFLRRAATSTFVPDAWIFPGGGVDPIDESLTARWGGDEQILMRVCAVRELFEETGIWIGPPLSDPVAARAALFENPATFADLVRESPPDLERLVWTSRWVTPVGVPKRYDTWFFLVAVEEEEAEEALEDRREGVEIAWLSPASALARHESGDFSMVFPTVRNLGAIADFSTRAELLASREGMEIRATQPLLVLEGGRKRIVLPGEE